MIYIHWPFCDRRCPYCDFAVALRRDRSESDLVDAICIDLINEIDRYGWKDRPMSSIYFGGGTPSTLSPQGLGRILDTISHYSSVSEDCEISLEANPEHINGEYIREIQAAGVNRLSLGVQSLSEEELRFLGRCHTVDQAIKAVCCADKEGISNISIDLIYALPEQSLCSFEQTLKQALKLPINHLSAYQLSFELGTQFYEQLSKQQITKADDETVRQMYELLISESAKQGLVQYEISNFSKSGARSIHNSSYWKGVPYIGVGPSAHSLFIDGERKTRSAKIASASQYIDLSKNDANTMAWSEVLSPHQEQLEYLLLALRTCRGIELNDFESRFEVDFQDRFGVQAERLCQQGFAESSKEAFRLTESGMLLSDSILELFA